jgi:hypothetical protein
LFGIRVLIPHYQPFTALQQAQLCAALMTSLMQLKSRGGWLKAAASALLI